MQTLDSEDIEVYTELPENFNSNLEVAACYVEFQNKILLIKRAQNKSEGGLWGVPAGKVEKGENIFEAASRELTEETNIALENCNFDFISTLYIRKPGFEYKYHMFRTRLDSETSVILSSEHVEFKWLRLDEAKTVPLMLGADEALMHYRKYLNLTLKQRANVNAYLILQKESQILLALRKNTGYMDGFWCLVAGHAEKGEKPSQAIIREAKEEIGIDIAIKDLTCVHTMHRKTDRHNVELFFTCDTWSGDLINNEPNKCEKIAFFNTNEIPENTCDHILEAFKHIENKGSYSEYVEY